MPAISVFRLPEYCVPQDHVLTDREYRDALRAAVMAARELYADALLLVKHRRYARAAAIAVLAIEEVGKVKVLHRIFHAEHDGARKIAWNEYRRHRAKAAEMITAGPGLVDKDVRSVFSHQADALKQLGLYSNLLKSGDWVHPAEAVNETGALLAVQLACAMVDQLGAWESVDG